MAPHLHAARRLRTSRSGFFHRRWLWHLSLWCPFGCGASSRSGAALSAAPSAEEEVLRHAAPHAPRVREAASRALPAARAPDGKEQAAQSCVPGTAQQRQRSTSPSETANPPVPDSPPQGTGPQQPGRAGTRHHDQRQHLPKPLCREYFGSPRLRDSGRPLSLDISWSRLLFQELLTLPCSRTQPCHGSASGFSSPSSLAQTPGRAFPLPGHQNHHRFCCSSPSFHSRVAAAFAEPSLDLQTQQRCRTRDHRPQVGPWGHH